MGEGKTRINLRDYIKIRSNVTNVGRKGDDVNMRSGWGSNLLRRNRIKNKRERERERERAKSFY